MVLPIVVDLPTLLFTQFRHCVVIASFAVKARHMSMVGGKGSVLSLVNPT